MRSASLTSIPTSSPAPCANASGHGVAIDPENHTGLVSGNPATFFNTQTLEQIKTIPAPGADGYIFDAPTHHFFILSHRAPNLLVIDSKDGSVVGTVDAIGPDGANAAVEQGATDGEGHLYFDVANQHHIAVVDAKTLKVTGHFDLGEKGNGPAGLAIDAKNHILFAMCRGGNGGTPTCVILSAVDGKIITTLPLAGSSDGGAFNPQHHGSLQLARQRHAERHQGKQPHGICGGRNRANQIRRQNLHAGYQDRSCDRHHARSRSRRRRSRGSHAPAAPAAASSARRSVRGRGRRGGGGPQMLDVMFIGR